MKILKNKKPEVVETPTFDPSKRYTWQLDSEFSLSGNDFGILLNSLRAILSTEEAQRVLLADKASQIMEGVLTKAVENGDVVEASQE